MAKVLVFPVFLGKQSAISFSRRRLEDHCAPNLRSIESKIHEYKDGCFEGLYIIGRPNEYPLTYPSIKSLQPSNYILATSLKPGTMQDTVLQKLSELKTECT